MIPRYNQMGFTGSYVILYGRDLPPKVNTYMYMYFSAHFLIFNHVSNFIVFISMLKKNSGFFFYSLPCTLFYVNSFVHNYTSSLLLYHKALLNKRESDHANHKGHSTKTHYNSMRQCARVC